MKLARVMERVYCDRWLVQPAYHATVIAPIVHAHVTGQAHANGLMDAFANQKPEPIADVKDGIGYVMLDGVISRKVSAIEKSSGITDVAEVAAAVSDFAGRDDVQGIMLMIDSPGGTVGGVPELASIVKAASERKRVVAYVDGMACSAAYWIASQADEIIATESAHVGSVGVYLPMMDSSRAHEMAGIKPVVIKSGIYKGMGLPGTSLTDEQINFLRGSVESLHADFMKVVNTGRGREIDPAMMQGQDFRSGEAKAIGMIDEIGTFDDAVNELKTLMRIRK